MVFQIPSIYGLDMDHSCDDPRVAEFLDFMVLRNPRDLGNHVRRISLNIHARDSAGVYAALIDFFVVLGGRGLEIKRRMLGLSRTLLSGHEFEQLRELVESGSEPPGSLKASANVLNNGVDEERKLISVEETSASAEPEDPLKTAREYIEYSQVDQARDFLQATILQKGSGTGLFETLLEIYQSTGEHEEFGQFTRDLREHRIPIPEFWLQYAEAVAQEQGG